MKKISIIIPAFNEESRIEKTLDSIPEKMGEFHLEIIIVDDGSTDKTVEIIKKHYSNKKNLKILSHPKNKGKGGAIKTGMLYSTSDFALYMDADNATTIDHLKKFLKKMEESDIVIGSRVLEESKIVRQQPFYKRFLGKSGNFLIRKILRLSIYDTQCGFKLFNRNAIDLIFPECSCMGWGIDFEILKIAESKNLRVSEVPVVWEDDPDSKVTFKGYIKTVLELIKVKIKNLR